MNKKLAVIILGWHYPEYFYKQLVEQKIPEGWVIDFFCVSHRDPSDAKDEKVIDNNTNNIFDKLDSHFYKKITTKVALESLGWNYLVKPNVYGDWSQFNQWTEDYDYKEYDVFLISGDDNLFITDTLFTDILNSDMDTIIDNGKVGKTHTSKIVPYNYDDWWVISNSVHHGRGVLRGSMEFFKREMFDVLGGTFDLNTTDVRIDSTSSPSKYSSLDQIGWNKQVYPFMITLEKLNLYDKVRFLSPNYRVSNYCIEGERGMFKNNNCLPYKNFYYNGVLELLQTKKLDKFI